MKFLIELWPRDEAAELCLQEIIGLKLTGDTSHQKIFLIVGPRRSGKGTIGWVVRNLVGPENVASPTIASLGTEFGMAPLIDKRVAIIEDARVSAQSSVIAERLLTISGEGSFEINRKYQAHWHGPLTARFLILTNELPKIADASRALASRFVLLALTQSFYGQEDHGLRDKLRPELPGIFNWALEGLDRLRKRGRFETPKSSLDAVRQLEDLASPISAFLRDWCVIDRKFRIEADEAFRAWGAYCERNGHKAGSASSFGRDLRTVLPQMRDSRGHRQHHYLGLDLSQQGEHEFTQALRERRVK
jgi:putative DNA primase/helicase